MRVDRNRPRGDVVEAPPSRYRVIEKNGRLVVLDRGMRIDAPGTAAAPVTVPKARAAAPGSVATDRPSIRDPGSAGPFALLDRWARALAGMFGERWEPDGRLALRGAKGKGRGAGARLTLSPGQARGYGWSLLGIVGGAILLIPVNILLGSMGPAGGILGGFAGLIGLIAAVAGGLGLLLVRIVALGGRTG